MEARYAYFTYLLPGRDDNLSGIVLTLKANAQEMCGEDSKSLYDATEKESWKWTGPEVIRTYPSDDVIERISPEIKDSKPFGRWVPFTVQLIYRDAQGSVTRTENYASSELDPVFPKDR